MIWNRYRFTDGTWLDQDIEFTSQAAQATLFIHHKWDFFYPHPPWFIVGFEDLWLGTPLPALPDFDKDNDVDQTDYGYFQRCLTGSGQSQPDPACIEARLDADEDVDQDDFGIFQACFSGPIQPLNPNCVN